MSRDQIFFVSLAFAIVIVITAAAQFQWLGHGRTKTVLVFISGIAVIVALRIAELPPDWFSGSKSGFGMVVWLTLSAFVMSSREERAFGVPLLMGMSLTLLAANLFEVVARFL